MDQKPKAVAFPFSETRFGVSFELRMFEPTAVTNDVVLEALQILMIAVRHFGGRDVRPRIVCDERSCAEFVIGFLDAGG